MWYFLSPRVTLGEGALAALADLRGRRALVVTDANLVSLGTLARVVGYLKRAGLTVGTFDAVEPEPGLETVVAGARFACDFAPTGLSDWGVAPQWTPPKRSGCCMNGPTFSPATSTP